jgi:hypothetical protein
VPSAAAEEIFKALIGQEKRYVQVKTRLINNNT